MALFVRRLRLTDLPRLEALEASHPGLAAADPDWIRRFRKLVELSLSDEPEGLLIADLDGEVVGWAATRARPLDPFAPICGQLVHVSVAPGAQGKGVGRRLVREAEAYLRTRGCTTIRFYPISPDSPAAAFARKAGYPEAQVVFERRFREGSG